MLKRRWLSKNMLSISNLDQHSKKPNSKKFVIQGISTVKDHLVSGLFGVVFFLSNYTGNDFFSGTNKQSSYLLNKAKFVTVARLQ